MRDKRKLLVSLMSGGGGSAPIVYDLQDDFNDTHVGGALNNTIATPIGGVRTVTDTNSKLNTANGLLNFATGGSGLANPGIWYPSTTRVVGKAFFARVNKPSTVTGKLLVGFANGTTYPAEGNLYFSGAADLFFGGGDGPIGTPPEIGVDCVACSVLRSAGAFTLIKGGIYTDWTLLWVNSTTSTANLRPGVTTGSGTTNGFEVDNVYRTLLGSPWDTDYGISTSHVASPAIDEVITQVANAIVAMSWTAVTGQTWNLLVRYSDAQNYWAVRCSQGGSTIKLIEVVAGAETERASAAQTFTNGTAYRLNVVCDGSTIITYIGSSKKNTYTSASFNNTATGVKTDRAGTDLVAWPRNPTGAALQWLTRSAPALNTFTVSSSKIIDAGSGANDWVGRGVLCDVGNGTWIMGYRQAIHHTIDNGSVFHLRFSINYGTTWTDADKFTDGSSCVGAPFSAAADGTDGILIKCPNGNILLQMYRYLLGTQQYRSVDGGKTWTDEGIINSDTTLVGGQDHCIVGSTIYITTWFETGVSKTTDVFYSADNGATWTQSGSIGAGVNEAGICSTGGNNMLIIARDDAALKTFSYTSTDLGATWSAAVDITEYLSVLQRPRLRVVSDGIFLVGRDTLSTSDMYDVIYFSKDSGASWRYKKRLYSVSQADCAYEDILLISGNTYYMVSYGGTKLIASLKDYVFTFDYHT